MNFCMKTRFAMYYLCQHQFSQLALFTEQILLCLFTGKAMVQHLWLLYTVERPHRAPCILNKWLDSPGAGHTLPSLDYLPGPAGSSLTHPVLVMHAGV